MNIFYISSPAILTVNTGARQTSYMNLIHVFWTMGLTSCFLPCQKYLKHLLALRIHSANMNLDSLAVLELFLYCFQMNQLFYSRHFVIAGWAQVELMQLMSLVTPAFDKCQMSAVRKACPTQVSLYFCSGHVRPTCIGSLPPGGSLNHLSSDFPRITNTKIVI